MLAARAADGYGQVGFALFYIKRQQVLYLAGVIRDELLETGTAPDVGADRLVQAGLTLKARNIIRVGKEPHVHDKVRVQRDAVFIPEGDHSELHLGGAPEFKRPRKYLLQFAKGQIGGVYHLVGPVLQFKEYLPLLLYRLGDVLAQRMAVAGLGKTLEDHGIGGVHEDHFVVQTEPAQGIQRLHETF